MRLRYYLRGLAVGILLTTIVLVIANADNRPLTDAEIRQRALELGMIESESVKLSSLQQEQNAQEHSAPETSAPEQSAPEPSTPEGSLPTESMQEHPAPKQDAPEANTPEANTPEANTPEASTQEQNAPEESASDSAPVESSAQESASAQPVSFRIESGASSYTVSKKLAALGLVEDAVAFDTYLCNSGYSKRIRVGTYEIMPGTSEEEIAKMIAQ